MKYTRLLDSVLVAVVLLHLLLAPYSKVEESFNLQAIHDILNYGVFPSSVLDNYDHKEFPGVVPRTFVGSVAIAGAVKVIDFFHTLVTGKSLLADDKNSQLRVQIVARAVFALANVWGLLRLRNSMGKIGRISKTNSRNTAGALFYSFSLLAQFHLVFYASRTLPNFVALPLVNFGLSKLVAGDLSGLTWLAFSGVVFRLEVGVFATAIALVSSLIFGQSNIFQGAFMLAAGSIVGLALTYTVDSYFWGTATVPELQAFLFNVVQGRSVEWGTEPYSAYFSKYIVNFFRPPQVILLAIIGLLRDPAGSSAVAKTQGNVVPHPARNSLRILAISAVLFVSVMSFQPHKEWRFIVYIAPVFTLLASHGFAHLWSKSAQFAYKLLVVLMIGSTVASLGISSFMAYASSYNYPGGAAITYVNGIISEKSTESIITVHMDVPACMTGITRFTELHRPNVIFDKTETEHALAKIWNSVDYLITHKDMDQPLASDLVIYDSAHWDRLTSIPAFAGVNVRGVFQGIQLLMRNEKFRSHFVTSVFSELKKGECKTLSAFVKNAVVLKNYLHVYKRTAPDRMPTILESPEEETAEGVEEIMREYEEQLDKQIDPQDIRESVNEQINRIEDSVEERLDEL